jgi:hypothetical protein
MESHFRYEERAVSDAIDDQVQDTGWTTAVFEFRSEQRLQPADRAAVAPSSAGRPDS